MSEFLTQATANSRGGNEIKLRQYVDLVINQLTEETGCRYRFRFRRSRGSKTRFSRFSVFLAIFIGPFLEIVDTNSRSFSPMGRARVAVQKSESRFRENLIGLGRYRGSKFENVFLDLARFYSIFDVRSRMPSLNGNRYRQTDFGLDTKVHYA